MPSESSSTSEYATIGPPPRSTGARQPDLWQYGGDITGYHQPGGYGVRVDTTAYEHHRVQHYYDSLVAKLICWGDTRPVALQRMRRALGEYVIEGIKTNLPFLRRIIDDERFGAGKYDTRLVEQILSDEPSAVSAWRPPLPLAGASPPS